MPETETAQEGRKTAPDGPLPSPVEEDIPEPKRPPCEPVLPLDLTEKTCRYVLGDPNGLKTHFCGCPTLAGSPYCEFHHRAWHKPPKKKGGHR